MTSVFASIVIPLIGVHLTAYLALNLVAFVVFLLVGTRLLGNRQSEWPHLLMLTMAFFACELLLAHVAFLVNWYGPRALLDPASWSFFQPPYWGGPLLFGGFCAVYFLLRRQWELLDVTCISWAVAKVPLKSGCWFNGCCRGRPSTWLWCSWFGGRHPSQLYEVFVYALSAALLLVLFRKGWLRGRLVVVLAGVCGLARLGLDGFRETVVFPASGEHSLAQIIGGSVGLACALVAIGMVARAQMGRSNLLRKAETEPSLCAPSSGSGRGLAGKHRSKTGHEKRRGRDRREPAECKG